MCSLVKLWAMGYFLGVAFFGYGFSRCCKVGTVTGDSPLELQCSKNMLGEGLQGKDEGRWGWLMLQGHFFDGRGGFTRHGLALVPVPLEIAPLYKGQINSMGGSCSEVWGCNAPAAGVLAFGIWLGNREQEKGSWPGLEEAQQTCKKTDVIARIWWKI